MQQQRLSMDVPCRRLLQTKIHFILDSIGFKWTKSKYIKEWQLII